MDAFRTFTRGSGRVIGVGFIAGWALSAPACGEMSDEGATGVVTESDPIINGTLVANDTIGTPAISSAEVCSGTLIRNDWVLSAKHCFTWADGSLANPNQVAAQISGSTTILNASRIVRHPSLDVTLVRLTGPLPDASGQTFANPLYVGSDASLVSQPVDIQGFGFNTITSCTNSTGTGSGLRSMTAPINQMSSATEYKMLPAVPGGQIIYKKDSGSTPFTTINGFHRPTGVSAYVHCQSSPLQVYESFFVRSDAFRGWLNGIVGHGMTGGPISGFEREDHATVIAYTSFNPTHVKVLAKGSPSTPNWTLQDMGGFPASGGDVPSYVRSDGQSAVLYVDGNHHVVQLFPGPNGTTISTDLSADAGGPTVAAGGHLSAYVRSDNLNVIVFGASDGSMRELSWSPGAAHWANGQLTPAGSPAGYDPAGYVRGDGISAVVYVDTTGHIQELSLWGGWVRYDLTSLLNAPAVRANGRAHVYSRSDGYSIVLYLDNNLHIWELAMSPDGWWSAADLTSMFSCQQAYTNPYGYVRADGMNAVVFNAADGHVWELALAGSWVCSDLTAAASGAPIASTDGPYGFVGADLRTHVVYRSGEGHVRDLMLDSSGQWIHTDATQVAGGL